MSARHVVYASSFADPKDIARFRKCKEAGKSDEECFKVGDNAVGCWGASTAEGTGPSCALPPDYMIRQWGSINGARHKPVRVAYKQREVTAVLKDRMPWVKNCHSQARIDLNPDCCFALGLNPPIMEQVTWWWLQPVQNA